MSITFNGINGNTLGCIVEKYPARILPRRLYSSEKIPGRNGNLTRFEGYANVHLLYDVYLSAEASGLQAVAEDVVNWLYGPASYARLEDSYNTGIYRMAQLAGPDEVLNYFQQFGRCTLDFEAMPQRWLTAGETATTYSGDATITNPTQYEAQPLIVVSGTGDVEFNIGGYDVVIDDMTGSITLDCEVMDAYDNGTNLNNTVTLPNGWPKLAAGANALTFVSGSITDITVTPRWWTL